MKKKPMPTHYHIQELRNGLRIRSSKDMERWERLLVAGLIGVFVAVVSANFLGAWWCALLSPLAATLAFALAKANKAELQATNMEFVTTGDLGRRAPTRRSLFTADILQLEFQAEDNPFMNKLDGLYALTTQRQLCVLPYLDWQQTQEVIDAIKKKFPGLAQNWCSKERSAWGGND